MTAVNSNQNKVLGEKPSKKPFKNLDSIPYVKVYETSKPADVYLKVEYAQTQPQIIQDLFIYAAKISRNERLLPKARYDRLKKLSKQIATGWPFKNTARLTKFSNTLAAKVEAMADQILAIEVARAGRKDVGIVDELGE